MATVRMFGQQFAVDLIRKISEDQWEAKARAHTARTAPGTTITVLQSEIIEAATEMPRAMPLSPEAMVASQGRIEFEAAMAKERAELDASGQSAANLIERHRAALKEAGKLGGQ